MRDILDLLLALRVERAQAVAAGDQDRVEQLDVQISALEADRRRLRR